MILYSTHPVVDIIRDVRVILDHNCNDETLTSLEDEDTLTLDELIRSKIEPAAEAIEGSAPLHKLDGGEPFASTICWEEGKIGLDHGYIELPSDFHRLIVFQMGDWSRSVSDAIGPDDPLYTLQGSEFSGIRGTPEKPVVAITHSTTGPILEFWGSRGGENATVRRARYLPLRKISEGKNINFSPQLKESIEHYAGYLTALTLGETALAERLKQTSLELAGIA